MTTHPRITRDRSWVSALAEALSVPVDESDSAHTEATRTGDAAVPPGDRNQRSAAPGSEPTTDTDDGSVKPVH